mmetsp:Transcript_18951/g.26986  ORF Transcript_18951/g.26986 Transcript_18951/m.26986 type:complete len:354 (-) Transcript_18951:2248-3309(-)
MSEGEEDLHLPTDFPTTIDTNNSKPKPTAVSVLKKVMNGLNLLSYIVVLSTYIHATYSGTGINNITDEELLYKHPTLLTPNYRSTKFIWGVIFFTQGVFAVAQLALPRCRDHILLIEGIGPMYILASVSQLIWYVSWAYGMLVTSMVFFIGVLVCAVGLLVRQYRTFRFAEKKMELSNAADMIVPGSRVKKEVDGVDDGYYLLRLPFGIYAGWIVSIFPLMLSIVLSTSEVDVVALVWVSVMSVALLTGLSMGLLLRKENGLPSYSIPSVVAYFFCGVRVELEAPSDIIFATYDEAYLNLMKNVSAIAAVMLFVTALSRFAAVYLRDLCIKKEEENDEYDATAGLDGGDYVQA